MSEHAKPASGCTGPSSCYAENIRKVYRCIGLLNSMVRGGERHSDTSARATVEALDALDYLEQHNASVSISGDEPEYAQRACSADSPWPLRDVVSKLIEAADILLDDKDYDGDGHELIHYARSHAREWIKQQNSLLDRSLPSNSEV